MALSRLREWRIAFVGLGDELTARARWIQALTGASIKGLECSLEHLHIAFGRFFCDCQSGAINVIAMDVSVKNDTTTY